MAASKFSIYLFTNSNCEPIVFHMPPCAERKRLRPLIQEGGGQISSSSVNNAISLLPPNCTACGNGLVSSKYIDDCVKENKLLDVEQYKVLKGDKSPQLLEPQNADANIMEMRSKIRNGRVKYLVSEDLNIIRYLLQNDNFSQANGNRLWKEMEGFKVTSHSWQSMKDRYRNRILPNIKSYQLSQEDRKKLLSQSVYSAKQSVSSTSAPYEHDDDDDDDEDDDDDDDEMKISSLDDSQDNFDRNLITATKPSGKNKASSKAVAVAGEKDPNILPNKKTSSRQQENEDDDFLENDNKTDRVTRKSDQNGNIKSNSKKKKKMTNRISSSESSDDERLPSVRQLRSHTEIKQNEKKVNSSVNKNTFGKRQIMRKNEDRSVTANESSSASTVALGSSTDTSPNRKKRSTRNPSVNCIVKASHETWNKDRLRKKFHQHNAVVAVIEDDDEDIDEADRSLLANAMMANNKKMSNDDEEIVVQSSEMMNTRSSRSKKTTTDEIPLTDSSSDHVLMTKNKGKGKNDKGKNDVVMSDNASDETFPVVYNHKKTRSVSKVQDEQVTLRSSSSSDINLENASRPEFAKNISKKKKASSKHSANLRNFVLNDSDVENSCTEDFGTQNSQDDEISKEDVDKNLAICQKIMDWLDISPAVFAHAVYLNNGSVDNAVRRLLYGGQTWDPTDDAVLLNCTESTYKALETKYGETFVAERQSFLIANPIFNSYSHSI